ncbi:NAD(P)-binding protein [Lojkania enalia]|uniref:NAD(P)-binding protein n=1 Tax=Lojkania enalia TaxID=147567 RepID=A0A9P4K705_9PLEO|nr:NAD(P)-binding protein [Didymosphaeria enalia]
MAPKPLKGEITLVTSATGGIGRAIYLALASQSCAIFAHDNADRDGAINLKQSIEQEYNKQRNRICNPTILINNTSSTAGHSSISYISSGPLKTPSAHGASTAAPLFISSVAGFTGGVVGPHYASSKPALHGKGITVNGVASALIERTKMLPDSSKQLARKIPISRLSMPEEAAKTVPWTMKTSYVTNKVTEVDGGMFPQ